MQGEHKNPFIYISTYCNNISRVINFCVWFQKNIGPKATYSQQHFWSVQSPYAACHSKRRSPVKGGKTRRNTKFVCPFCGFGCIWKKKKSGTKDEQLNKKTDKIHQKIDWKTKKLSPINVVHAHPLNDSAEVCFQYTVHLFQLCIHIG